MMNVFEPVRIKGKLFGKNVTSGEIAAKGIIRDIQLRNAEKNREVLFVAMNGRVTRMPAAEAGVAVKAPEPIKMSFMAVREKRDPQEMFTNLERLQKWLAEEFNPA